MEVIGTVEPHRATLLTDFSLEMTARDVGGLLDSAPAIPPGTHVNITYLGNEDDKMRTTAARSARELGFIPVPHISARRLRSTSALDEFLADLQCVNTSEEVFIVGGDPEQPEGPYADALSVIDSGQLERHGVRRVSIAGYPEGHPAIDDAILSASLGRKAAELADRELSGDIVTQFCFDTAPVLAWIEAVRQSGVDLPIRIGVAGPAGVRRLLTYAKRFGVGTGSTIVRKYGLSLTNLMSTSGPERFLDELAATYDSSRHGPVGVHFYTFGGLGATTDWIKEFRTP